MKSLTGRTLILTTMLQAQLATSNTFDKIEYIRYPWVFLDCKPQFHTISLSQSELVITDAALCQHESGHDILLVIQPKNPKAVDKVEVEVDGTWQPFSFILDRTAAGWIEHYDLGGEDVLVAKVRATPSPFGQAPWTYHMRLWRGQEAQDIDVTLTLLPSNH